MNARTAFSQLSRGTGEVLKSFGIKLMTLERFGKFYLLYMCVWQDWDIGFSEVGNSEERLCRLYSTVYVIYTDDIYIGEISVREIQCKIFVTYISGTLKL